MKEILIVEKQDLVNIADSIRKKTGSTELIDLLDMPEQIMSLGGSFKDSESVQFGANIELEGNYSISSDRLNEIAVEVQRLANTEEGLTPSQIVQKLCDTVDDDEFIEGTISHIHNDTVTKIKPYFGCEDKIIISVDCPNVESMGVYAFSGCSGLTDVSLPKISSVPDYAFNSCGKLANIDMSLIKSIGSYSFSGCVAIKNASFTELESVGNYAFDECTSLETLDAPKLKTVGYEGFDWCTSLREINCPELETVDGYAFRNTRITNLYLPKLTSVPTAAFNSVPLESIDFPSVVSFAMQAMSAGSLRTMNLPSCTSIGRDNFAGAQIEDINGGTVNLPILKSAGDWSFANCKKLKTIYLPEATSTGQCAFENCTALTRCEFEKKVDIGPISFDGCTALETVILRGDTMSTLYQYGYPAFSNTPIASGTGYIYVPRALVETYKANSRWAPYVNQFRAIEDWPDVCDGKEVVREYVVDTTKEAEYTFDREYVNHTDNYSLITEYKYESTEKEIDSGRMISLVINTDDKSSVEGLVIEQWRQH